MQRIFLSIIAVVVVIAIAAAGAYFYILYQIKTPLAVKGEEKSVIIEKGLGVKEIAKKLENEKLIRGAFYFKIYVRLENITNLQAGEYVLNSSMSIPKIVEILSGGRVNKNEIKVTIPEGFTVKQIDERLAQAGLIKAGDLINLDPMQVPSSKFQVLSFEGFLFPDTYIFNKNSAIQNIVQKMIDNFNKKITPEMRTEIEKQGKKLEDMIIMASIVQQEAVSEEEMPKIAGVFYNRLAINMPLQSDPTVNYVTGKSLRQVTAEDMQADSPYNTYKYRGLPPGAICNPGLAAIKAAIYPEKHDYYYFLHPIDAPTVFSKTEEEHRENKARWLRGVDF